MPSIRVHDLSMAYTERGDGPTVLALHAATSEGMEMGWLAHAIEKHGFNVVTPDQRGHGRTANPASDMNLTRLVDDILEFLYALGRTPVHGIGFSMGGAVLLYAALRRTEFFRSLVLLGTNYRTPSEARLRAVLGPPEQRSPEQQVVFDPARGAGVGWMEPVEAFGNISLPTLIVCADRDEFNDAEDSVALYRAMPNAEVLVVPHCDHLGLVRHPLVMQSIGDFYKRLPR